MRQLYVARFVRSASCQRNDVIKRSLSTAAWQLAYLAVPMITRIDCEPIDWSHECPTLARTTAIAMIAHLLWITTFPVLHVCGIGYAPN